MILRDAGRVDTWFREYLFRVNALAGDAASSAGKKTTHKHEMRLVLSDMSMGEFVLVHGWESENIGGTLWMSIQELCFSPLIGLQYFMSISEDTREGVRLIPATFNNLGSQTGVLREIEQ